MIVFIVAARKLWRDYFASGVDGVVFIVDAVDRARFPEAKKELDALLLSDELANVPFLVLGNKIDLGTAPSEEDLRYQLGLYETYGKEVSCMVAWTVEVCSMTQPNVLIYRPGAREHLPSDLSNCICVQ